jgi:hypothetical protein
MEALELTCARRPNPQAVWIHQIHAAGGAGGFTTMVAVIIGLVVCCGWSFDVTSLLYVKKWYKNNLMMRLTALLSPPPMRAPYPAVAAMAKKAEKTQRQS